jgi:predicted aspartyl protease
MRFPYRRYDVKPSAERPEATAIYRPVIPIRVFGPEGQLSLFGLLDTGADATVLPAFVAQRLGVHLQPQQASYRAVGGSVVAVSFGTIELEVRQSDEAHRWSAQVGFLDERTVAVLGHAGFLERFDATFRAARREVILEIIK